MPTELKRCPACGGYALPSALDYGAYFPDKMAYGVCCYSCSYGIGWFETPEEAYEEWNRRKRERPMDLYAYLQINDLNKVAKENGIEIPRLRGYRLMKDERVYTQEEIDAIKRDAAIIAAERLCEADPDFSIDPDWYASGPKADRVKAKYLIGHKNEDGYGMKYTDIRWDRLHGKKRKNMKYVIKQMQRNVQCQFDTWNKYAGQENVLYIHSRMGGGNWEHYGDKASILNAPWFLDRVDDWWDYTYCDFYAKIKPITKDPAN